ncbi:NAD(P)H-dependent oxidoreductase [Maliponia aquimaris]|uniref:Flavodoxin-like fold domain-containing protein n=1 Tax=Maliponia aquimaris TaxID=1673631 RepID=A0A238KP22_9RHOB|nr:NAD(P)H-dependent oxidoreductase [Maliponia aquimaris]SMX44594.1 hypothetical protein MAA8898_03016 [Maliponia aquimaris]
MRALVVSCHPKPESFTGAVCAQVLARLEARGAEVRHHDLYAEGFDPVLSAADWDGYLDEDSDRAPVARQVADLAWCDTLILVYRTWWSGLPAMLKGWLDRVLLPGVAFALPKGPGEGIAPALTHITRLAVFTTCGASWWLTWLMGAPGRRTLLRGVRALCARRCRTVFVAQYLVDASTPESRARHLARVGRAVDRL